MGRSPESLSPWEFTPPFYIHFIPRYFFPSADSEIRSPRIPGASGSRVGRAGRATHNRESLHVRWFGERAEETTLYLAPFTPPLAPFPFAMPLMLDKAPLSGRTSRRSCPVISCVLWVAQGAPGRSIAGIRTDIAISACNKQSRVTRVKHFSSSRMLES